MNIQVICVELIYLWIKYCKFPGEGSSVPSGVEWCDPIALNVGQYIVGAELYHNDTHVRRFTEEWHLSGKTVPGLKLRFASETS